MTDESMHWADQTAEQIIKERKKKEYAVATGATPSGTLHIGNFREFIMGDLIARALRDKGKKAVHYHYWDDYDVFRKVPVNIPKKDVLKKNLRKPLTVIPDVIDGKHKNYAEHHKAEFEKYLPIVGVKPTVLSNTEQYKKCVMAEEMKTALEGKDKIKEILNEFRKEELGEGWLPISVYDEETDMEATGVEYAGGYELRYKDKKGNWESFDFRKKGLAKFKYRIQVPAFWHYKGIDFESAGKDHYAAGGVFNTARTIAKDVYKIPNALGFGFGWISVKGGKQFSSSQGIIFTLKDVLEVYEPSLVRWLFAGSRPLTEFAISFDLDVLKIYEDFDKCERIYYKKEKVDDKERLKQKRIYELSSVDKPLSKIPFQPSFRHLCNVVQIYENDFNSIKNNYNLKNKNDIERLKVRAECVWNWLSKYAPDAMKFHVQKEVKVKLDGKEKEGVGKLVAYLKEHKKLDEKLLYEEFYNISKSSGIEPKEFFKVCYKILIDKERGPRLAPFILTLGKERVLKLFGKV